MEGETCVKPGCSGTYEKSNGESTEWTNVYRCDDCGDKGTKPTGLNQTAKWGGLAGFAWGAWKVIEELFLSDPNQRR